VTIRLPVLFMLAPQRFLQRHKDAEAHLLANEQRLFTVWDLHHTLRRLARFAGTRSALRPLLD
jgi:hypothetical protein